MDIDAIYNKLEELILKAKFYRGYCNNEITEEYKEEAKKLLLTVIQVAQEGK